MTPETKTPVCPQNAPVSVVRVHGYIRGVFKNGLRWWLLDFDLIARALGVSRRTVEAAIAWIRRNWTVQFSFRTRRLGRIWAVEISARNFGPLSPTPPIPAVRSEKVRNTAGRVSAETAGDRTPSPAGEQRLRRLAAFIARHELAPAHWDNCKVRFGFGHAFNFALHALRRGHCRLRITGVYRNALSQRHRDATDYGLNTNAPVSTVWEPSSTVSLAWRFLADGRENAERVADRLNAIAPIKAENARLLNACRGAFAETPVLP